METTAVQDATIYQHTLPNGLRMFGQEVPGVQSAAIVFWVMTGTRDEDPGQMGVSHFLEHMGFRRTPTLSGPEIDRAFEEMGADYNAATSMEMTFYWARVLSDNVPWALDVVSGLTQPVLDAEDFNQERQVILEEIARGEDSPIRVLLRQTMRDYFGEHPLSWDTLGTTDTIKNLTVEQMRDYWAERYGTRNMLFAIAGNFRWDDVVNQVETLSRDWEQGQAGRQTAKAPFSPGTYVYPNSKFVQEQIAILAPSVPMTDPRYFAAALLATILGDDTGSRLFWSIRQTGLAETATAQIMEFEDNGIMFIHMATDPDRASAAVRTARAELARIQAFDVQQDELDRAKAKLESSIIIGGESTNERVMRLISSWLSVGRLETLEELRQKIEAVTLEDLRSLVEEFPMAPQQVITAVGPLTPEQLQVDEG